MFQDRKDGQWCQIVLKLSIELVKIEVTGTVDKSSFSSVGVGGQVGVYRKIDGRQRKRHCMKTTLSISFTWLKKLGRG